jgi:hypothetical protein
MVLSAGLRGRAQFLGGIFNQSSTRLQYYAEEIASLQLFIGKAEKGFSIMESGIQEIGSIKKGEFNLHTTFFHSLAAINPSVAKMSEVAEIIALQAAILEQFSACMTRWKQSPYLRSGDLDYLGKVYSTICQLGLQDVNDLLTLTTASKLTMSDDQRISRIRALDGQLKDQYGFVQAFSGNTDMLCAQRQAEQADIGNVRSWYGLQ